MMTDAQTPGRLLTAAVLLLSCLTMMANATIAPSLPGLRAAFAQVAGIEQLVGLLVTLPSLAIILTAGIFGALADRISRQTLLVVAAVVYAAGGTSGLWAESIWLMLAGRILLGVGVAGVMTLSMVWVADLWQGEARARFMGLQGAAMSGGGVIVMMMGGLLASLHWRGAFAVYALVLPIAGFALLVLAPHARRMVQARSVRAQARDGAFPWAVFAVVAPLAFLYMASFYIVPTRVPFLLQELGVINAVVTALVMAGMVVPALPGGALYGQIRRVVPPMMIFALAYGFMGVGIITMALAPNPWVVAFGSFVMGVGMGPVMPHFTAFFLAFVPASERGRAAGLLTTAIFAGQFASPLLTQPFVSLWGLHGGLASAGAGLVALALGIGAVAVADPQRLRPQV